MAKILGMATIRVMAAKLKPRGNPRESGRLQSHPAYGRRQGLGHLQQDGLAVHQGDHCAAADMDVIEISSWEDVTVMFYGDNGLNYMMTGSATDNPAELDEDSGTISANYR
ncbi:phage tail tube protein [Escherichia coli]|uniref:phage tail tube protein n=1 Tax=Escherichia coli TaxID=562 RepID=UPI002FCD495E